MVVAGLIYYPASFLAHFLKETNPVLSSVLSIFSTVLNLIIDLVLIRISLKFCDSQKVRFSEFFGGIAIFFKFIFSSILYGLAVIVGLVLLIIPGIILGFRLQFYGYLIVEKGLGPLQALNKSFEMTKGYTWQLFLLGL